MSYGWGRRLQPKALHLVVRLSTLFHEHHDWVLVAYLLVSVGLIFDQVGFLVEIGHVLAYVVAVITALLLAVVVVSRRLFDPVGYEVRDQYARTPIQPGDYQVVSLDGPEFNQLVELGEEAFAAWGGPREEREQTYAKFLTATTHCFYLMTPEGPSKDPAGFSSVFPVTRDAFRQFRLGLIDSWEFSGAQIRSGADEGFPCICINALYLRKQYRHIYPELPLRLLLRHLAEFIKTTGGPQPILFAEGLTRRGCSFLKKSGFETYHRSKDGYPIFEMDFGRIETMSDRAQLFKSYFEAAHVH